MKIFLGILSLILIISCAKEQDDPQMKQAKKNLAKINKNAKPIIPSEKLPPLYDHTKFNEQAPKLDSLFVKSFCTSLEERVINNNYAGEIFTKGSKELWKAYATFFKDFGVTCGNVETLFSEKQNTIIKVEIPGKEGHLLLTLTKPQGMKIDIFHVSLLSNQISFKKEMVSVSDTVDLATYTFTSPKKKPIFFLKSPYLNSNLVYLARLMDKYIDLGFHVVAQSNRGTYESEGEFRWLHKENIGDQQKTIDWITSQSFYQGGVLPYGVSYDGFNALAAAATNSPHIKTVIACSAPANASTDSFTANGIVELGHLLYLNTVKDNILDPKFHQKLREALLNNTPLEQFDEVFTGRDQQEWLDILSLVNDSRAYFLDRNLLPFLKKSKVPILFAAGFSNDQDSRDSMLSFEALQHKKSVSAYYHKKGHGCGDLENEPFYKKLLQEVLENRSLKLLPKITVKYAKTQYVSDSPQLPMPRLKHILALYQANENPNESLGITFIPDNIYGEEDTKIRTIFLSDQYLKEDLNLYGPLSVKLRVKSYSPFNGINISLNYLDSEKKIQPISNLLASTYKSRTQALIETPNIPYNITLRTEPVHKRIPKGSLLVLEFSSANSFQIPFYRNTRTEFRAESEYSLGLVFLSLPQLELSLKPELLDLETAGNL